MYPDQIIEREMDKSYKMEYQRHMGCSQKYGINVIGLAEGKQRENSAEKDI